MKREEIDMRESAAKMGLLIYNSGRKCKHGHDGKRFVSNSACVKCRDERAMKNEKKDNFYVFLLEVSNKKYLKIGVSSDVEKRKKTHLNNLKKLYPSFSFELLFSVRFNDPFFARSLETKIKRYLKNDSIPTCAFDKECFSYSKIGILRMYVDKALEDHQEKVISIAINTL